MFFTFVNHQIILTINNRFVMRLKNLLKLFIVPAAILLSVSCDKDPKYGPAEIGINVNTLEFSEASGEATISLLSNRDWTVEIAEGADKTTWLGLSVTQGKASKDSVKITISVFPNKEEDRTATINFKTETIYASLKVTQKGVVQKQYTPIATVRALYKGTDVTVTEDYYIKGSVISNCRAADKGGLNNTTSPKNLVISDDNAGITLYLAADNTEYVVGDEIAVGIKGLTLKKYNNLSSVQLDPVPLDKIQKLGTKVMAAKEITAEELLSGKHESMYVAVKDVQVNDADKGKKFVSDDKHTSLNFVSKTGEKFVLFSSKYSTYKDETVPSGSGILKGIAMVYGTTHQISITALTDYAGLTGARFDGGGGGGTGGGVIGNYADWNAITPMTSFADNFVSITTANVAYENKNWMFFTTDGSSVNMGWKTGIYSADKYLQIAPYSSTAESVTAYALMPRINVKGASVKTLKFDLAWYYQTADNSKFEVVTSNNFTGNFTTATWTVLKDATFAAADAINKWNTITIDLASLATSESLCIAFRYTGKANTYRLDNVQVADGKFPEDGGGGGGDTGEGTGGAGDGIYTSNVTMPATNFSDSNNSAYGGEASIGGTKYPLLKIGKSTAGGTYTFAAPLPKTGSCTLSFYGLGWSTAASTVTVTVNGGGKIDGGTSKKFALGKNAGVTGNPPFTITFGSKDFYKVNLTEITATTTLTFSTDNATGPRCIIVGLNVK